MVRKVLGVVGAVLLALIGTGLLVAYVRGAEDRALAGEEVVEVLVVREDVPRGTEAEALGDYVAVERVPKKVRAIGGIDDLDALNGQVAAVDLVAGEQLVRPRFVTPAQLEEESQIEVPEGLQEVTLSLEPHRAMGGKVKPGDTVGIFASFDLNDKREDEQIAEAENEDYRQRLSETSKMILHKLLVTSVQWEQVPQTPDNTGDEASSGASGGRIELAPTGNLLVTFAVSVEQAERMIFTAEHGTVWLSAEPETADEDGSVLRTPGNIYND
ncbi:Flp pilus assembly protein CpaB [Egicoccus sp. AB-alg2]|uniref:Flp pilus assembly protein CpaB n=1 Tax=Egicoccus sp. AB-alg2 TaxID=3242693 RepID=UPI00359F0EF1